MNLPGPGAGLETKTQFVIKETPMPVISEGDFEEYADNYLGWCTECQSWTVEECEPDISNGECWECGGETVYGAEQAVLLGHITVGRVH